METFVNWLLEYANHAHWFIFGAIILAGMNIPISADLMVIISAVLAATVVPEHTFYLFGAVFLGCLFSAWVAYWIGRIVGPRLLNLKWFSKILHPERLTKIRSFYEKWGLLTLIIGRFIPFGARNCMFMTAGMSKSSFSKFILRDLVACGIWSSVAFYLFYILGQNYKMLYEHVKTFNILIFSAFSVTLIAIIWYKKVKKRKLLSKSKTNIE